MLLPVVGHTLATATATHYWHSADILIDARVCVRVCVRNEHERHNISHLCVCWWACVPLPLPFVGVAVVYCAKRRRRHAASSTSTSTAQYIEQYAYRLAMLHATCLCITCVYASRCNDCTESAATVLNNNSRRRSRCCARTTRTSDDRVVVVGCNLVVRSVVSSVVDGLLWWRRSRVREPPKYTHNISCEL